MTTPREQEVLDQLCLGHPAPRIAERLSLSRHTVHGLLRKLRLRHHVDTTLELAVKLLREQLEEARRDLEVCQHDLAVLDRRRRVGA